MPYRLGLDLGSTTSKAVILAPDQSLLGHAILRSNHTPSETAQELIDRIVDQHHLVSADLAVVATGYGRSQAEKAARAVTEITCHAKGVRHLHPDSACILDIGGQDAKAIRMDRDGGVDDFAMNDRCAAGTGRFLEVAAARFGLDVGQLSKYCGDSAEHASESPPFEITSTCVVFAESELVGLAAKGTPARETLRAVHRAIGRRVTLLLKQVGAKGTVYFTGGVAQNETLLRAVAEASGLEIKRSDLAQFTGALGAALLAE